MTQEGGKCAVGQIRSPRNSRRSINSTNSCDTGKGSQVTRCPAELQSWESMPSAVTYLGQVWTAAYASDRWNPMVDTGPSRRSTVSRAKVLNNQVANSEQPSAAGCRRYIWETTLQIHSLPEPNACCLLTSWKGSLVLAAHCFLMYITVFQ